MWNILPHLKPLKNSVLLKSILGVEQIKYFRLFLLSKIKQNQIFSFPLPYPNICSLFFLVWKKIT